MGDPGHKVANLVVAKLSHVQRGNCSAALVGVLQDEIGCWSSQTFFANLKLCDFYLKVISRLLLVHNVQLSLIAATSP